MIRSVAVQSGHAGYGPAAVSPLEDVPSVLDAAAGRLGSPSSNGARRLVAATVCYRQVVTRFGTTEPDETTRRAISELRRIGGLTWAELGQLFGVSPQRMHSWASGGTPDAGTEQHLLRLLDVIRHADRGDARSNRTALFEVTDVGTPFDLLASEKFEVARTILGSGSGRRRPELTELDDATKAERRPSPPEELVDALNDSVHQDLGHGRAACTVRSRRRGLVG